jgi:Domain of unknown function (DUF4340)
MAMSTDKKLGIAVVILLALGAALYFQRRAENREEAAYSLKSGKLPKFGISDAQSKQVDKITIQQPAHDAGLGAKVVLKKEGKQWNLLEPVKAKANQSNVDSLLDNLKELSLSEQVSDTSSDYSEYGVDDKSAVHAVFNKGSDVIADLYFGHGGSRGQMLRIAGKTGVFVVKGYSSYIYTREAKQWRDMQLLKFDDAKVESVDITNEHGAMEFTKEKPKQLKEAKDAGKSSEKVSWVGKYRKGKSGAFAPIARFESSKVDDMLRAYKDLNALDYAQDKGPVDTGLGSPVATVTINLEDGAHKELKFGKTSESSSRWVEAEGNNEAFTISTYAADWVTSDIDKYQKAAEKKDNKK